MPDQNGSPTVADLDLSGIAGAEHLAPAGGAASQASPTSPAGEAPAAEPVLSFAPDDTPDYSAIVGSREPAAEPQQQQQQQQQTPEQLRGDAPADAGQADRWSDLLARVPEPLHQELRPLLDEYGRQFERAAEELAPYRPYIDRGFNAQDIQLALQIQDRLLSDPRSFWESLGRSYGWNRDAAPTPGQQQQQGEFDDLFADAAADPGNLDPRVQQAFQTLAQQQAALAQQQQEFIGSQQAERNRMLGRQAMEQEFAQIESKYGQFDRDEVVRRAFANASQGANPTLTYAFHQLKDYEKQVLERAQQRPVAPTVMGTGTGLPAPAAPKKPATEDERREAALRLAIQLGATPPGQVY